ncbi:MAG: hypothetical protein CM1200mP41_24120 [Gammaproteobacteria bacterium]|nr:MAG: hypothetical protein CM1200mP41_24120 [Gammaproteobacteria bacterium]
MTGNWLYGSLERQFATQPIDQLPKADVIVFFGGCFAVAAAAAY